MASLWILDVNGVLLDSSAIMRDAFATTAARYGFRVCEADRDRVNGLWLPDAYRILAPHCDPMRCTRAHLSYARERWSEIRPYPHVAPVLELARSHGVRIGAVTSYGDMAEECLVRSGLYRLIDCLVSQEEVLHPKPHPEIVQLALKMFGHDPAGPDVRDVVYVGDAAVDVQAGKAANVPTGGVTYGMSSEPAIRAAAPDYVLHSFNDMSSFIGAMPHAAAM